MEARNVIGCVPQRFVVTSVCGTQPENAAEKLTRNHTGGDG